MSVCGRWVCWGGRQGEGASGLTACVMLCLPTTSAPFPGCISWSSPLPRCTRLGLACLPAAGLCLVACKLHLPPPNPLAAQPSRRPTFPPPNPPPPATHHVQLKFIMDKDGNPTRLGAGSQGVVYKVRCAAARSAVHAVYGVHAAQPTGLHCLPCGCHSALPICLLPMPALQAMLNGCEPVAVKVCSPL